ncbi:MAG: hypothetical protein QOI73_1846, partial [Solirubrobacteraceae bacterium]|nr:hypothetical protein [Solirubrobacteraceae bacterium]
MIEYCAGLNRQSIGGLPSISSFARWMLAEVAAWLPPAAAGGAAAAAAGTTSP